MDLETFRALASRSIDGDLRGPALGMADRIEALEAEIARLREALAEEREERWQPIETAPKDGRWFVIWTHGGFEIGRYDPMIYPRYNEVPGTGLYEKKDEMVFEWSGFNNFHAATRWTPLPEPPKGDSDE